MMSKERNTGSPQYKSFGLALQALVVLAQNHGDTCPSCYIAESLHSEATLLRRILANLVRANILETREGREGGYLLKKDPALLTVADVYIALEVGEAQSRGLLDTTCDSIHGIRMNVVFTELLREVDRSILETLKHYTIADLVHKEVY
jgi:Rrf2 family transcriptional repressor of oqxAB